MNYDLAWLAGSLLTSIELCEGGSWRFSFGGGVDLHVECPWRIIHSGGGSIRSPWSTRSMGLAESC